MTGKIRTLRVDKGFGFIKDEAEKEYLFHQSAVSGERWIKSSRATVWSSRWARGRRALAPKTCAARLRKRTESRRRPVLASSAATATLLGTATSCPLGRSSRSRSPTICPREGPSSRRHALEALAKCLERAARANQRRRAVGRLTAAPFRNDRANTNWCNRSGTTTRTLPAVLATIYLFYCDTAREHR